MLTPAELNINRILINAWGVNPEELVAEAGVDKAAIRKKIQVNREELNPENYGLIEKHCKHLSAEDLAALREYAGIKEPVIANVPPAPQPPEPVVEPAAVVEPIAAPAPEVVPEALATPTPEASEVGKVPETPHTIINAKTVEAEEKAITPEIKTVIEELKAITAPAEKSFIEKHSTALAIGVGAAALVGYGIHSANVRKREAQATEAAQIGG